MWHAVLLLVGAFGLIILPAMTLSPTTYLFTCLKQI